jgi:hypothetical protein
MGDLIFVWSTFHGAIRRGGVQGERCPCELTSSHAAEHDAPRDLKEENCGGIPQGAQSGGKI